ncbi:MAG: CDP-archaeol synthase [Patescibacteria group bacterium]
MSYFALLYLALPAFVANMLPVFATKINFWPWLNFPVDGGKKIFSNRIFGANKSFRGLIVGTVGGAAVGAIQFFLTKYDIFSLPIFANFFAAIIFGALAGLGALVGDLAGSFLKRLFQVAPGRPFIPIDQIDYIVGLLVFTNFLIHWDWRAIIFLLIFATIVNPIMNISGYFLGVKKTFW